MGSADWVPIGGRIIDSQSQSPSQWRWRSSRGASQLGSAIDIFNFDISAVARGVFVGPAVVRGGALWCAAAFILHHPAPPSAQTEAAGRHLVPARSWCARLLLAGQKSINFAGSEARQKCTYLHH